MEIKIGIKIPTVPNFIMTDDGNYIAIEDLSDSELDEIGKEWTIALKEAAKKKRRVKENEAYGN